MLPSGRVTVMLNWLLFGWYSIVLPGVTAKLSVAFPQRRFTFGPVVAGTAGGRVPLFSARHFSIAVAAACASGTPGDLLLSNPSVGVAALGTVGRSNEPAG